MTFGAMAAWQAWLLLGAAAAAAAALFLIKLRPPRMIVPSLLLWRKVLDESRELTLWERIRRAVSLVVTIVIALAIAFAMTRPGPSGGATATTGRVLIVVDSSWSMQAHTRTGETRWQRAIAEGRRLTAAASGGEVALATTADGLVEGPTTDGALIETALDRLAPGGGETSAWPELAGAGAVHFLTDGAVNRSLPASVIVHSVFEPAANVAVTALDVRPSLAAANAGDAYVEIANFAAAAQTVRVTLTRGETGIFNREMSLGRRRSCGRSSRSCAAATRRCAPACRPRQRARGGRRGGRVDRQRETARGHRRRPAHRVAAGRVRARPRRSRDLFDPTPATTCAGQEDVTIFVGWAPAEPRSGRRCCSRRRSTPPGSGASARRTRSSRARAGSPPAAIRWCSASIRSRCRSIGRGATAPPSLTPVALSERGTPLVYVSETPAHRFAVVTFGADESNLAGAPGFPVLIGNALDWLTHPSSGSAQAGPAHRPRLVTFEEGVARVTGPDGADVRLARVDRASVGMLRQPGFYAVEGGGARSTIAINAGDQLLSNLTRAPSGRSGTAQVVEAGASGRAWWIYFAVAAFALALAEWWTWQRRITV